MCAYKLATEICWTCPIKHLKFSSYNSQFTASLVRLRIWAANLWFVLFKPLSIRSRKALESVRWVLYYMRSLMLNLPLLPYQRRSAISSDNWMSESRVSQVILFPQATRKWKKRHLSIRTKCQKNLFRISVNQKQYALSLLTSFSTKHSVFIY